MIKLTDRQKAILAPQAVTLIEAGYVNLDTGTLTEAGRSAMWLILTTKYAKEFLKVAEGEVEKALNAETLANAKNIIANS